MSWGPSYLGRAEAECGHMGGTLQHQHNCECNMLAHTVLHNEHIYESIDIHEWRVVARCPCLNVYIHRNMLEKRSLLKAFHQHVLR